MTENEAIEKIKWIMQNRTHNKELCLLCIKALEEIQALRAIGTVEEFKAFRSDDFTQDLLNMGYTKGLKDGYEKAITEFTERLNNKISDFVLEHKDNLDFASGISVAWNLIDEIAEEMRCAE